MPTSKIFCNIYRMKCNLFLFKIDFDSPNWDFESCEAKLQHQSANKESNSYVSIQKTILSSIPSRWFWVGKIKHSLYAAKVNRDSHKHILKCHCIKFCKQKWTQINNLFNKVNRIFKWNGLFMFCSFIWTSNQRQPLDKSSMHFLRLCLIQQQMTHSNLKLDIKPNTTNECSY